MTTLIVSRFVDGTETVVGKIEFDGSGDPKLSATGPAPERSRLETVWNDIAARDSVPMNVTERKEVDGEPVIEYNARLVRKGDENYPYAVSSLLQSQYGYLVDQQL
jgi:hypothetical protein